MWKFLFSPNGRISRSDIWLKYFLPYLGIAIVAAVLDAVVFGLEGAEVFGLIVALFYFWPSIAVSVKRFHDRGMSGWWALWFILIALGFVFLGGLLAGMSAAGELDPQDMEAMFQQPAVLLGLAGAGITSIVSFVILFILPGKKGPNQYGEDPLSSE